MQLEENLIFPEALKVLKQEEWDTLDAEFAQNSDPLSPNKPRQTEYDLLFTHIAHLAPSPIGLGES